eukprot:1358188-Amorphochlora_amoeboformis.AAC.1
MNRAERERERWRERLSWATTWRVRLDVGLDGQEDRRAEGQLKEGEKVGFTDRRGLGLGKGCE